MKTSLAILILVVGFIGGLVASGPMADIRTASDSGGVEAPAEQARPAAPGSIVLPPAGTLPDLSPVAEAALKVAANITSTSLVRRRSPFPFFFDDGGQYQESQSLGSGVVVSSDGYLLTNAHVIGNAAAAVKVTLSDGREHNARVVGTDALSDLAVLKIEARNLQTLQWGDSSRLRVGEWVLAVGNPFQLSGTVTLGIISTVSRSQSGAVTDFIQTDAAINPGNSGGALVNARGELVGINSMIYSETGGYQGIGFAIPSRLARRIMDELVANGSVQWGSIGSVLWADPATARRAGYDVSGLLIYQIAQSSPAYRAGLRTGDVVVALNGQRTGDGEQFDRIIASAPIGSTVRMEVLRDNRKLTLEIPIVARQQRR